MVRKCVRLSIGNVSTSRGITWRSTLDGTTGHHNVFAVQLPPDLVGTVDLQVGLPDTFDLGHQHLIAPYSLATLFRIAPQGNVAPVAGRGNLQLPADWLDPKGITMFVDETILSPYVS